MPIVDSTTMQSAVTFDTGGERLAYLNAIVAEATESLDRGLFSRAKESGLSVLDYTRQALDKEIGSPVVHGSLLCRTRAHRVVASCISMDDRLQDALEHAWEAHNLSIRLADPIEMIKSLVTLGTLERRDGNFEQSLNHLLKAEQLSSMVQDDNSHADSLGALAALHITRLDHEAALSYGERALNLARKIGAPALLATNLSRVGAIYLAKGDYPASFRHFNEAVDVWYRVGNHWAVGTLLGSMGGLYVYAGNFVEGVDFLQRALSLAYELGNNQVIAITKTALAGVYEELGDYSESKRLLGDAIELRRGTENEKSNIYPLTLFANILCAEEDFESATSKIEEAFSIAASIGLPVMRFEPLLSSASIAMQEGKWQEAKENVSEAERISAAYPNESRQLHSLRANAKWYAAEGNPHRDLLRSVDSMVQAIGLAKKLEFDKELTATAKDLARIYLEIGNGAEAAHYALTALDGEKRVNLVKLRQTLERANLFSERQLREKLQLKNEELAILNNVISKKQHTLEQQELLLKDANDQLLEANRKLEDALTEVSILNEELNISNEHLRRLNQEKDDFLNFAAHDLKNPLTGIMLAAEVAQMRAEVNDDNECMQCTTTIMSSAQKMQELVVRLLDVNAIENGELISTRHLIHVDEAITRVVSQYEVSCRKKNISLLSVRDDDYDVVLADPVFLQQAIDNLVSNAVKYSPLGQSVTIRRFSHTAGNLRIVSIAVHDHGPGISDSDKPKLFKKFSKLSAKPTGGESSNGLGLAFVKQAVEMMGGRVLVDSTLGEGATFTIQFSMTGTV